jgi:hypothetical protein
MFIVFIVVSIVASKGHNKWAPILQTILNGEPEKRENFYF